MSCLYVAGFLLTASGGFPSRVSEKVLQVEAEGWGLSKYCKRINMFKISRNIACAFGDDHGGGYDFIFLSENSARPPFPSRD